VVKFEIELGLPFKISNPMYKFGAGSGDIHPYPGHILPFFGEKIFHSSKHMHM
jgi:hypothetical protein